MSKVAVINNNENQIEKSIDSCKNITTTNENIQSISSITTSSEIYNKELNYANDFVNKLHS